MEYAAVAPFLKNPNIPSQYSHQLHHPQVLEEAAGSGQHLEGLHCQLCSILAWEVEGLSCWDALEHQAWTVDGCHVDGYGMMDQKLV